jgi:hypothetical protein
MILLAILPVQIFAQGTIAKVEDRQTPLSPNAIKLSGVLENDIQNSIEHWNKGVVPYAAFVDFFRNGKSYFAIGEMRGKAVRSGCMFYRYTQAPELKKILSKAKESRIPTSYQK